MSAHLGILDIIKAKSTLTYIARLMTVAAQNADFMAAAEHISDVARPFGVRHLTFE